MTNFADALKLTLGFEGGLSVDPQDPGGRTYRGITQRVYDGFRDDAGLPHQDVVNIAEDELTSIYCTEYWLPAASKLPAGLNLAAFDFAVNSGASRAVKELQTLLNVTPDGIVGLQTTTAIPSNYLNLLDKYADARLAFMKTLRNWDHDKGGWQDRVAKVREASLSEADTAIAMQPPVVPTAVQLAPPALPSAPKADPAGQMFHRTKEGITALIGGAVASAPVATQTAEALKPYIGHDLIGHVATAAVVVLTTLGGALGIAAILKPYLTQK